MGFAVAADHRKDRQIQGPYLKTKKAEEHKGESDTKYSWCAWNGP